MEATDWIIKYFMKDSFSLFALSDDVFAVIAQKDSVLISSRIHNMIQELEKKHKIEDLSREIKIERLVLINS